MFKMSSNTHEKNGSDKNILKYKKRKRIFIKKICITTKAAFCLSSDIRVFYIVCTVFTLKYTMIQCKHGKDCLVRQRAFRRKVIKKQNKNKP